MSNCDFVTLPTNDRIHVFRKFLESTNVYTHSHTHHVIYIMLEDATNHGLVPLTGLTRLT
jgi:hypothetical protein